MIDSLHLYTHHVAELRGNPLVTGYAETTVADVVKQRGYLRNLYVGVTPTGTFVKGSLARFAQGANLPDLTFDQIRPALSLLEESLGFDPGTLGEARVTRLDVGASLVVPRPVREYVSAMQAPARTRPTTVAGTTLYFSNTLRVLAVYDKALEAERSHTAIPEALVGRHLLRYELRLKRLSRDLSRVVTVADLSDQAFFDELVAKWLHRFETIRFAPVARITRPVTVPELRDDFASVGVEAIGGRGRALDAVDVAAAEGHLDAQRAHRQRAWLTGLATPRALTPQVDVGAELTAIVRRAATAAVAPAAA